MIRSNNEIMSRPRNIKARTQNSTNINILNTTIYHQFNISYIMQFQHKFQIQHDNISALYNMQNYQSIPSIHYCCDNDDDEVTTCRQCML